MTYEPRLGDGTLFPNERLSEKSPNHTGYIVAHRDILKGEKLSLAGWTKHGSRGDFISLRLSDPRTKEGTRPEKPDPQPAKKQNPLNDEIPF